MSRNRPDSQARGVALLLGAGRVLLGLVGLAAPGRYGSSWSGAPDGDSPSRRLFIRVIAARDLALGITMFAARDDRAELRTLIGVATALDVADVAAQTLSAPDGMASAGAKGNAVAIPAAGAGVWAWRRLS